MNILDTTGSEHPRIAFRWLVIPTLVTSFVCLQVPSAIAQQSSVPEPQYVLEEIQVTARRREQSLIDTPLAITALTEQDFKEQNFDSLFDVGKAVPNMFIGNFGNGNPNHISVFIRGTGQQDHIITVDSAVGLYLDGVYLGRQVGANLSLSNIERVEVSRGPQGTLYGRNTIGGAINFVTKKPSGEEVSNVAFQIGSRGRKKTDFYGSTALSETISISLSTLYTQRNGIGDFLNVDTNTKVGEIEEFGSRGMLEFTPNEDFSLLLTTDFSDTGHGQQPVYFNAPSGQFPNSLSAASFANNQDDSATPSSNTVDQNAKAYGFSATANWDMSDVNSLKAIASYRSSEYKGGADQQDDTGFAVFPEIGKADQLSLEVQLAGNRGIFDYVTGIFYYQEDGETISQPFEIAPSVFTNSGEINVTQKTNSFAVFGSIDTALSDVLTLGLGLRVTRDEKEATGVVTFFPPAEPVARRSNEWTEPTGDLSLTYAASDNYNLYGAISRGYQSGGYPARPFPPAGGVGTSEDTFVVFNPQFATNYEVGIKGVFLNRLRLAVAVFYTEYTDLQLQANTVNLLPGGSGFLTIIENAGKAESKGVEIEALWQATDNFSVQSAIGYLDSEFTEVASSVTGAAEGNTPQLTPEWTFTISPQYVVPLDNNAKLYLRMSYNFRGEMFGEATNNPLTKIDSRSLLDFNIRYQPVNPSWNVSFYGKNVTNEVYDVASGFFADPAAIAVRNNDRSEFGIRLEKLWN